MELKDFFKLLKKYRNILVIIPLVIVIISYFLVRNLADEYVSSAKIATGIVDQTRQLPGLASALQESKVFAQFSNIMEVMQLKKMIDMVSYQLIIHDLSSNDPFHKLDKKFAEMTPADKAKALKVFRSKLQRLEPLSLYDPYEEWLNKLLISMHYDERSIRKAISVRHDDSSDFITVVGSSDKPQLSAFMVNTLCQGFISYHTNIVQQNETQAVEYLSNLLTEKKRSLDSATNTLQQYKIAHNVLDLQEQAKSANAQIAANEDKILQAQKDVASNQGALDNIDKKFDPADRKYVDQSATKLNLAVTTTMEQMHQADDRYIRSNFDPKLKVKVDSLQARVTEQLNQATDKYISNPLLAKEDLLKQKLALEVARDLAAHSIQAMNRQQENLNNSLKRLVPLSATIGTYEFAIEVATKEYQEVLNRYNQANLQEKTNPKLLMVEYAVPDIAQPSKKMLLVIISGVGSFIICMVAMFVLFYLDDTIKTPLQLVNKTNLPVLGYLNLISGSSIDLRKLWDIEHRDKMQQFKDLLRAIRFEIDQEMDGEKVLAITSMKAGEGKTLLAISLAYSYSMINKKVLLIDGNFDNPTISKTVNPRIFLEDVFKNADTNNEQLSNTSGVLGNHGNDVTLLEISDEKFIHEKFNELKRVYDVIIIEAPSLDTMNKSKEWLLFANKFIAVYEAGKEIANGKKQLVKYLQNAGDKFGGWVLNKSLVAPKKR
ncbi:exopolysaccharide transport family protein [Mucilaginibacter boryungensis]|uniref:AAA family ATPase n=1 Tax=Mucilaginibacter boryungensis TaxID=768480 RepID=A0ABR9XCE4_9SPHI|nr:AAA family ATPase [Mucilaginibacter boryungensis]MBE9664891.1 AAA family ATPase [Mucilaginibacter boryungensis]